MKLKREPYGTLGNLWSIKEEDIPISEEDYRTYLTCEWCNNWEDGEGPCSKGFEPQYYEIDGGPNPSCHIRIQCFGKGNTPKHWEIAKDIKTVARFTLDSAACG